MNFETFKASREFVDDLSQYTDDMEGMGFVYLGSYWIEMTNGRDPHVLSAFYTLANRDDFTHADLRQAEMWLWEEFVKYEYNTTIRSYFETYAPSGFDSSVLPDTDIATELGEACAKTIDATRTFDNACDNGVDGVSRVYTWQRCLKQCLYYVEEGWAGREIPGTSHAAGYPD